MRWIWYNTILIFCFPFLCAAQKSEKKDYAPLLTQLESEVSKGNLIALRDLGTLLDKKSTTSEAQRILKSYTFFLEEELNWNQKVNRKAFLNFFYNNKNQIRFFHPAEVFYIAALDVEEVDYKIEAHPKNVKTQKIVELRKNINRFEKAVHAIQEEKTEKALNDIIELDSRESRHYLLQVLQERLLQKSKLQSKIHLIILLCQALQNNATMETLEEVLKNIEDGFLPFEKSKTILAHLTNHSLAEMNDGKKSVAYFHQMIDSLETMENIRFAGYENIFDFNKYIFPHEVDYYGRIVSLTNDYPWMKKNAIQDLMATEHERAYMYLAADFYKNYLSHSDKKEAPILKMKDYEKFFYESNQLIIKVLNKKGAYANIFDTNQKKETRDEVLRRNFLLYWLARHGDFEWNPSYRLFINKFEILTKTENYEKLFRRLNSSNDEVAMESFIQLTEGTPAEIYNLSNKYRQLLRSYNKTLPNIRHLYLEQMAELTDFCKDNNITYQPDKQLKQKLDKLREDIPMAKRYRLENRIINSLDISEVTAVEYYTCLYENNNAFTFSIGRILDHFYSANWNLVVENDAQLRLYLKKATLFQRIETDGLCNSYKNKLDQESNELISRLKDLLEVESDDDIIFIIESVLPKEVVEESNTSDLHEFIEHPVDFSKNDIQVLPVASNEDFQKIINQMKNEKEVKVLKKYLEYLRKKSQIRAVPIYFQLIDNQTIISKKYNTPITLADLIVSVIEEAYNHHFIPEEKTRPFATEKWKTLWEEDGKNYENWEVLFFEQKLKQLQFADKIKIDVINDVFDSEHYLPKYKVNCLEALKKVRPLKKIKRLDPNGELSVKTDLQYFEDFFFNYKDLSQIPRLFEVDDAEKLFDYLNARTEDFDESELGTFWNNIFRQDWFLEFINSKNNNRLAELENIKGALEIYLNESDVITEYEEQTTHFNINTIESIGKDLVAKIQDSFAEENDEPTKALIQQSILARASYEDIGKILAVIDQLSSNQNFQPYMFLTKDFGLPIFNLDDEKERTAVIKNHQSLNEYDFYIFYLKAFGVDFLSKKGKLDFQKIYELLQFEIITPFVGGGGSHRDQFTYGLIKILELHFKTRLGFHKKLNENQTFYTFTSTKRANAWRKFLLERNLAKPTKGLPPSFNHVVNNN